MCGKLKIYFMLLGFFCVLCVTGCEKEEGSELMEITSAEAEQEAGEKTTQEDETGQGLEIYVDVCGEVRRPGVYCLDAGSRVFEAVKAAGGLTKDAADHAVNQAQRLADGQQIYIPSKEEVQTAGGNESILADGSQNGGKVNLNTASREELMTLQGIGQAKAEAILRYREEHGNFQSIEEIKKIEGIKDGVFQKVKDQITV